MALALSNPLIFENINEINKLTISPFAAISMKSLVFAKMRGLLRRLSCKYNPSVSDAEKIPLLVGASILRDDFRVRRPMKYALDEYENFNNFLTKLTDQLFIV